MINLFVTLSHIKGFDFRCICLETDFLCLFHVKEASKKLNPSEVKRDTSYFRVAGSCSELATVIFSLV